MRRDEALAALTATFAEHDADQALAVAQEIARDRKRSQALAGIVATLAEHGPDQALEVARGITDDELRADALVSVGVCLGTDALLWLLDRWTGLAGGHAQLSSPRGSGP